MVEAAQQPIHGFHPTKRIYRFTILFFVSLLVYGSYFVYDSLPAIQPLLIESLGITQAAFGASFTIYSISAIIFLLLGGLLIDRIGTRKSSLIFSCSVALGALIIALSPNILILYVGMFLFGAGSETLIVAQSAILARWFKGKELALAFGIALTVSRLGSLFSYNIEAQIADFFGHYSYALWAGFLFCLFSILCNIIYIFLDRKGEHVLKLKEGEVEEKIVISDIVKFKPSFWFVTLLCVTFYSAIFPFQRFAVGFFNFKWDIPLTAGVEGGFFYQVFTNFLHMFSTAGGITSIIIFASMIFAPFAGKVVDKIGRRASLMILGSILMVPAHLLMGVTDINPIFSMVILGAAFVLVPAAMWPSVPLIVSKQRVGTAFGLMTMIQNIGLGLFPFLNGKLIDLTSSYTASQIMFASLGLFGLVFALLLKRADAREGAGLEKITSG